MPKNIKTHIKEFHSIHYITLIMAISLQIQITLFTNDDYLGMRIGLADIFMPFLGIFIVHSLITKKSHWPKYHLPFAILKISVTCFAYAHPLVYHWLSFGT